MALGMPCHGIPGYLPLLESLSSLPTFLSFFFPAFPVPPFLFFLSPLQLFLLLALFDRGRWLLLRDFLVSFLPLLRLLRDASLLRDLFLLDERFLLCERRLLSSLLFPFSSLEALVPLLCRLCDLRLADRFLSLLTKRDLWWRLLLRVLDL